MYENCTRTVRIHYTGRARYQYEYSYWQSGTVLEEWT